MAENVNPNGVKRIQLRRNQGRPQLFDPNKGPSGEFVGQPFATMLDGGVELKRLNELRNKLRSKRTSKAGNPFKNAVG